MNTAHRKELGRIGETFAFQYVKRSLGWDIVVRNWRCSRGEIDLVARDGDTLVVIEVRTRTGDAYGGELEAVDVRKAKQVMRLTPRLLCELRCDEHDLVRFDVILLKVHGRIHSLTHIRNAFDGLN